MGEQPEKTTMWSGIVVVILGLLTLQFYIALVLGSPTQRLGLVTAGMTFLGPVGAAIVAWRGVSMTMRSNRQQDLLKEWHSNLRWATELCATGENGKVSLGVAILDSLDDLPFLSDNENHLIDAVIEEVVNEFDRS
ncbi:hypothetical protein [Corynebacterium sp. UBA2622]|uniref:hypothetical protein n=1 Tax=Corynebacterium sp. UBA2622 TaxID=1946393 RepID=UPI0025C41015|nr:hypothetical protein [Corynebacterium sp. UBA2622]